MGGHGVVPPGRGVHQDRCLWGVSVNPGSVRSTDGERPAGGPEQRTAEQEQAEHRGVVGVAVVEAAGERAQHRHRQRPRRAGDRAPGRRARPAPRPARHARPRSRRRAHRARAARSARSATARRRRPAARRCRRRCGTLRPGPEGRWGHRRGTAARARRTRRRGTSRRGQGHQVDAVLAQERRLLEQRGRRRTTDADLPGVARHLDQPADEPDHGEDDEDRGQRAQRRNPGGKRRPATAPAAPARAWPRRSAHRRCPTASRARTRRRPRARAACPRCRRRDGEDQHQQRERNRGEQRPPQPDQRRCALGAVKLPARHQRDRADRDRHEHHRMNPAGAADEGARIDHRRQQRPDRLPERLGDQPDVSARQPDDRPSGVMIAINSPATRTIPAAAPPAIAAATIPGSASRSRSSAAARRPAGRPARSGR